MDGTENSKALQQLQAFGDQEEYITFPYFLSYPSTTLFTPNPHINFSNLCPLLFSTKEFNELKNNAKADREVVNSNSFTPSEDEASTGYYSDALEEQHSCAMSDTDSSNTEEGGGDASDEEMSLDDELLLDGKAKKKIEMLAAMVGVDSMEPAVVLTEVVRVLKHLKRINQTSY